EAVDGQFPSFPHKLAMPATGLTDDGRSKAAGKLTDAGFGLGAPAEEAGSRGNNGNVRRSLGFAQPFACRTDSAQPCRLSEPPRTLAPNRQAGGHWFEPSTAHTKPWKSGIFVCCLDDACGSMLTAGSLAPLNPLPSMRFGGGGANNCVQAGSHHPVETSARE